MIINKHNVKTYFKIIIESRDRLEILKYILKRLLGKKAKFNKEIILKHNGLFFNCGNIMQNCTVACYDFNSKLIDELNIVSGLFVDIGAHIGKYSITVAKMLGSRGSVISIEPNKESASLSRKIYKLALLFHNRMLRYMYLVHFLEMFKR